MKVPRSVVMLVVALVLISGGIALPVASGIIIINGHFELKDGNKVEIVGNKLLIREGTFTLRSGAKIRVVNGTIPANGLISPKAEPIGKVTESGIFGPNNKPIEPSQLEQMLGVVAPRD